MKISFIGSILAVLIVVSSFFCANYLNQRANRIENDAPIETLPEIIGSWQMVNQEGLELSSRRILKLDKFVKRTYRDDQGRLVFLYIGYWKKQTGDYQGAKHSPRLCLPSNGWVISSPLLENVFFDRESKIEQLEVSSLVGEILKSKMLFYYWFFTGERTYYQDWLALLNISIERFLHGRSDGGIVEISTPISNTIDAPTALVNAKAALTNFTEALYPILRNNILKN